MTGQNDFAARLARIEAQHGRTPEDTAQGLSRDADLGQGRPDIGHKGGGLRVLLINSAIALSFLVIAGAVFINQLAKYQQNEGRRFFIAVEQEEEPGFLVGLYRDFFGDTRETAAQTGDLIRKQAPKAPTEG